MTEKLMLFALAMASIAVTLLVVMMAIQLWREIRGNRSD